MVPTAQRLSFSNSMKYTQVYFYKINHFCIYYDRAADFNVSCHQEAHCHFTNTKCETKCANLWPVLPFRHWINSPGVFLTCRLHLNWIFGLNWREVKHHLKPLWCLWLTGLPQSSDQEDDRVLQHRLLQQRPAADPRPADSHRYPPPADQRAVIQVIQVMVQSELTTVLLFLQRAAPTGWPSSSPWRSAAAPWSASPWSATTGRTHLSLTWASPEPRQRRFKVINCGSTLPWACCCPTESLNIINPPFKSVPNAGVADETSAGSLNLIRDIKSNGGWGDNQEKFN